MLFNMPDDKDIKFEITCDTPKLLFTQIALEKMWAYIDLCDDEIGWLGEIKHLSKSEFLCSDVFLLGQDVHGATTEIQPEDLTAFAESVEDPTLLERLMLWGHSHVTMGTSASGQDDKQMELFINNDLPYFFRLIANKHGDMSVTFIDVKKGIKAFNIPCEMYLEKTVNIEDIKKEIKEKVRKKAIISKISKYNTPKFSVYDSLTGWNFEDRYGYYDNYIDLNKQEEDDMELLMSIAEEYAIMDRDAAAELLRFLYKNDNITSKSFIKQCVKIGIDTPEDSVVKKIVNKIETFRTYLEWNIDENLGY